MKRFGNLYQKVCSLQNIELADTKARANKPRGYGVQKHDKHRDLENKALSEALRNKTFKPSKYTVFLIYEPKEREISRLPYYPDRIVHHAIMNILEQIWTKIFINTTYACIKGRGIHKLNKDLRKSLKDVNGTKYCLKFDIVKFYPSIDHTILKKIIRRKIKDKDLLWLLDLIIDSVDKGVPIGNYLSQFFANLYLAYFDHYVKEKLKVKHYFRYSDDIVVLGDSKNTLRKWFNYMAHYLQTELKLTIKSNYQIFPVSARGIDFVGYKFYHNHTLIRKSMKLKILKLIRKYSKQRISWERLKQVMYSYLGWLKYCNSKKLLCQIQNKTGIGFTNWQYGLTNISNLKGQTAYIVKILYRYKYCEIYLITHNNKYIIRSKRKCFYRRFPPKLLKL